MKKLKTEPYEAAQQELPVGITEGIDYLVVIISYKVIRAFRRLSTDDDEDGKKLKSDFDAWMNSDRFRLERAIAERMFVEEEMYKFFFGEEINERFGFELITDHLQFEDRQL